MRKGFTIIELLVASLLLGMLVTILTMIFNQSSIAWRIGTAGIADMDSVRDCMAELREEADNAFVYDGKIYRHVGLWDSDGSLRKRSCVGENTVDCSDDSTENEKWRANVLANNASIRGALTANPSARNVWSWQQNSLNVGLSDQQRTVKNYIVNVMSGGPNNDVNDWEAIWSAPDIFQ